ncbi:unnamed protein product, partial [Ixodes hexagonus]
MPTTTVRTTVVTQGPSTSFVSVQRGFISTISGLLTALEMVLGIIVFALTMTWLSTGSVLFLSLTSFTYWIISFFILLASALSATGTVLPTTLFYMVFHCAGFFLYLSGGISCIAQGHRGVIIAAGV